MQVISVYATATFTDASITSDGMMSKLFVHRDGAVINELSSAQRFGNLGGWDPRIGVGSASEVVGTID